MLPADTLVVRNNHLIHIQRLTKVSATMLAWRPFPAPLTGSYFDAAAMPAMAAAAPDARAMPEGLGVASLASCALAPPRRATFLRSPDALLSTRRRECVERLLAELEGRS
jgi:hypothetical protein